MEKEEVKFEEKLEKLEMLVKKLENGDILLDDAIKSFTEAMSLAKSCDEDLKSASTALTKIVGEDGSIRDFETSEA